MPSAVPTLPASLPCQIDGLVRIYTCNEIDAYFEFETKESLQKAHEKIDLVCRTNICIARLKLTQEAADKKGALDLVWSNLLPKDAHFAFSISAKSGGTVGTPVASAEELIKRVADVITTETSMKKDVPIVQIKPKELTLKY